MVGSVRACSRLAGIVALLIVIFDSPGVLSRPAKPVAEAAEEPDLSLLLETSRATQADQLIPGLAYRLIDVPAFGIKIHTFAFDSDRFRLRTAEEKDETGNRVTDLMDRHEDVFAIDGGFFEKDDRGRLSPSGLLVIDGAEVAPAQQRGGSGVLHVDDADAAISYRGDAPPISAMESAVQVGPILVDPGGKVGIHSGQGDRARRSAICLRPGQFVAIVVDGDGLSLFQLAELLAFPPRDGGLGCDIAINLDGGPSTQATYRGGGREIAIEGQSAVQNALVVSTTAR